MKKFLLFFVLLILLSLVIVVLVLLWPNKAQQPSPAQTPADRYAAAEPPLSTQINIEKLNINEQPKIESLDDSDTPTDNSEKNKPHPSKPKITELQQIEALQQNIAHIDLDQYKKNATTEAYLAYLLALEKCLPFHRYINNAGKIEFTEQQINTTVEQHANNGFPKHVTQHMLDKINLCKNVKGEYLNRLYDEVTYVANHGNIQAMMLLSHMPSLNLALRKNIDKETRKNFYHKQVMWLEQARQQGSLNALFNLAVRYHHGVSPDAVAAASYYSALQHFMPEYEYTETVTVLTENMKTWQKAEVDKTTRLIIEEMQQLPELYNW
ncbi:hypothetical protein [Catenovulum sediminis]|uniref:hypothetical protein n=1 Tax=Catenovulum sediminis TaxID=1740262 RepID=UPI001180851C|nr:hypothetical protein [Catenovulum sediminis]